MPPHTHAYPHMCVSPPPLPLPHPLPHAHAPLRGAFKAIKRDAPHVEVRRVVGAPDGHHAQHAGCRGERLARPGRRQRQVCKPADVADEGAARGVGCGVCRVGCG
eukprot:358155-Chlamydomonas_euryale.AAC.1